MFAPLDGVTEDPATGSANSALVGLLALNDLADYSATDWYISQGTEIGRPSTLYGRTRKEKGKVTGIWMGGYSTLNSEGIFYVDESLRIQISNKQAATLFFTKEEADAVYNVQLSMHVK